MGINWNAYDNRICANGNTFRDRQITQEKRIISHLSPNLVATEQVLVDNTKVLLNINSVGQSYNVKTFTTVNDDYRLCLGDIIEWGATYWIVTELNPTDTIYQTGKIQLCNKQISWQNPETLEIVTRWASITQRSQISIKGNVTVLSSDRQYEVIVPLDDETILVDLEKRFLLEVINHKAKAYSVTLVNPLSNNYEGINGGVIYWTLEQDELNFNTDNQELMVADYVKPNAPINPSDYHIVAESSTLKIGGSYKSFDLSDSQLNFTWSVTTVSSEFDKYVDAYQKDTTLYIKVHPNTQMNQSQIKVTAIGENGLELAHLFVKVVNIY